MIKGYISANGKQLYHGDIVQYLDSEDLTHWHRNEMGRIVLEGGKVKIQLQPFNNRIDKISRKKYFQNIVDKEDVKKYVLKTDQNIVNYIIPTRIKNAIKEETKELTDTNKLLAKYGINKQQLLFVVATISKEKELQTLGKTFKEIYKKVKDEIY